MIELPLSTSMLMIPRSLSLSAWLGHIPFASWVIEQLRPALIVELGTHRGASFLAFCQAVEEQRLMSRVFAVDTWEGDEHAGFYGEDIYAELRAYQQRYYASVSEMLRMRFDEALHNFDDGSIDLLHIDGLHTYDAVKEDFESWRPKLSNRAVVFFHDTFVREREFGVWRYWEEISQRYPSFEFTHTHGLGVLLVGGERHPELMKLVDAATSKRFAAVNQVFDVLGRNIKNLEEIERLYAALEVERNEIARLRLAQEQAKAQAIELQQMKDLMSGISKQLEDQNKKLDRLQRPWWRT